MHDNYHSEAYYFQRAKPSIDESAAPLFSRVSGTNMTVGTDAVRPMGAGSNGLEQGRSNLARHSLYELASSAAAADQLAIYRSWLESQVKAQKAKIQAMSSQYAIPISDLDPNPLQLPSLPPIPPVANAESTITAKAITVSMIN
ncbi:hypothetical protein BC826DRAFT_1106507 [Russula brevipes]|nr:hypothetical protein BC826DRAFT_1106507 [Russula brevipes]